MEQRILDQVENLLTCRLQFLNNTRHQSNTQILNRYLNSEKEYTNLFRMMLNRQHRQPALHTTIRIDAEVINRLVGTPTIGEDVRVTPTLEQIQSSTTIIQSPDSTNTNGCAICQEVLSGSPNLRINHCNHTFHHQCLITWFGMSTRCPECRFDVRSAGDLPTQTSAGDEETLSQ